MYKFFYISSMSNDVTLVSVISKSQAANEIRR